MLQGSFSCHGLCNTNKLGLFISDRDASDDRRGDLHVVGIGFILDRDDPGRARLFACPRVFHTGGLDEDGQTNACQESESCNRDDNHAPTLAYTMSEPALRSAHNTAIVTGIRKPMDFASVCYGLYLHL